MLKRWKIGEKDLSVIENLNADLLRGPLVSSAFFSLGITDSSEAEEFLNPKSLEYDPFIIPDMEKGVERINEAVENEERICVYGDYDADGITATAVVYSYLEGLGADVSYYIPERLTEGYGLHTEAIDILYNEGITLIVTVDNGISSHEEVLYAKEKGIDIVITDHHKVSETLPEAKAVINPQRNDCPEFKELAGVGVAFMLVCALEGDVESMLEFYCDLVMVGTLADVVPIKGINRLIIKRGMELIKIQSNPGLAALLERSNYSEINYQTVSFGIIPRINAAGRMGSAERALRLILSDDEDEIEALSYEVDNFNKERQAVENKILTEAREIIEREGETEGVIIASSENWHQGVLGIVAAKLSDIYSLPCILFKTSSDEAIGSGRSGGEAPLYDALKSCENILIRFGGHKFAAGLTVKTEDIPEFKRRIKEFYKSLKGKEELGVLEITDVVEFSDTAFSNVEALEELKPFGTDNPQPVFMFKGVKIEELYSIGEGKHTRIRLSSGSNTFYAVMFGRTRESFFLNAGNIVDVAFTVEVNEYQGKRSVSYKIKGIRPQGFNDDVYERSVRFCSKVRGFLPFSEEEKAEFKPTRDDFVKVYSALSEKGFSGDSDELAYLLPMPYGKIYAIVTAFSSLGLITIGKKGSNIVIRVNENSEKVDLQSAEIMTRF